METNPDLAVCIPEEGTNLWFDNMCILKNSQQKELAEKASHAGKDVDFVVTVDQELADVKPVRVAIDRIYAGEYNIVKVESTENAENSTEE